MKDDGDAKVISPTMAHQDLSSPFQTLFRQVWKSKILIDCISTVPVRCVLWAPPLWPVDFDFLLWADYSPSLDLSQTMTKLRILAASAVLNGVLTLCLTVFFAASSPLDHPVNQDWVIERSQDIYIILSWSAKKHWRSPACDKEGIDQRLNERMKHSSTERPKQATLASASCMIATR